jgi:ATP-dependent Clp protease ATP-binding subunit ClpA
MFERFGKDVRRAVVRAAEHEAQELGSPTVEAEHLLLALAAGGGPAARVLSASGLDHDGLREALEQETERSLAAVGVDASMYWLGEVSARPPRSTRFGASAKRALERAGKVAVARRDGHISAAHLLVGILRADLGTVPRALVAAEKDRDALLSRAEGLLTW